MQNGAGAVQVVGQGDYSVNYSLYDGDDDDGKGKRDTKLR